MKHLRIAVLLVMTTMPAAAQIAPRLAVPEAAHVLAPPRDALPAPSAAAAPAPPAPAMPARRLRFRVVRIAGARAVPPATVAALFAPLRGRDVAPAELESVLNAVSALYDRAGYPLGRAVIPAQRMKDGVLAVRVVEGYVETVAVHADDAKTRALVAGMAASLTAERPLTRAALERTLLLLQDIPGIVLDASFDAMDQRTGGARLVLRAHVRPVVLGLSLDNRGAQGGMPVLPYLTAALDNLFGIGDRIALTALLSPRQKDYAFYDLSLSGLAGHDGLRLTLDGSWAQLLDDVSLAPLSVMSRSTRLAASARYPLLRSAAETLSLEAGLHYTRTLYSLPQYGLLRLPDAALARDQYLTLAAGADYDRALSATAALSASLRAVQGLASLNAGPHTRKDIIPGFTSMRADARLAWQPLPRATLTLSATGQWSPDSLPAAQEIAFGGLSHGRGFAPAEISGDRGLGLSVQPQYRIGLGHDFSLSPYLLADYARAWNRRGDLQPGGELMSAGGGVRLESGALAAVTLEMDRPLNRTPLDRQDRDWRFYAGLDLDADRAWRIIAGSP